MSIYSAKSVYIHIPKTGGRFVEHYIRASGIYANPLFNIAKFYTGTGIDAKDRKHARLDNAKEYFENRYSFTFIREPISWLKSAFIHIRKKTSNKDSYFGELHSKTWELCLYKATYAYPQYYTNLIKTFVGNDLTNPEVDFIGKQENLKKDLLIALDCAGEDYDKQLIIDAPILDWQKGNYKGVSFKCSKTLLLEFKESEKEIYDSFYS